jgi:hypothetical protein
VTALAFRLDLPRYDLDKQVKTRRGGWPVLDTKGKPKTWKPVWDTLRGNSRPPHWAVRHKAVKRVIDDVSRAALAARIPPGVHVEVRLTWAPGRRVRADVDNLVALQKVMCDALARGRKDIPGLHLVPDDAPKWMTKQMPAILPPPAEGLWLDVVVTLAGVEAA